MKGAFYDAMGSAGAGFSGGIDNWRADATRQASDAGKEVGDAAASGVGAGALAAQGLTDQQMKDLGLSADASLASGIDENGNLVGDATAKLVDKFGYSLSGVIKAAKTSGGEALTEMAKAIVDHRNAPLDAFDELVKLMKTSLSPAKETAKLLGELVSKQLAKGLKDKRSDVRAQAEGTKQLILDRLAEIAPNAKTLGKKGMNELKAAMKSKDKDIAAAAKDIYNAAIGKKGKGPEDLPAAAKGYGANMSKQLAAGILSAIGKVIAAAQAAAQAVFDNLFTHSPAKSGPLSRGNGPEGWGVNIGKGFSKGLKRSLPNIGEMLGGDAMPNFMAGSGLGDRIAPRLAMTAAQVRAGDNNNMVNANAHLSINGGIHLHGVGSDVSPAAATRFSQQVLDSVAEGFQQQSARRGIQSASRP